MRKIAVIAMIDSERKRDLFHRLLDDEISFSKWLRQQIDRYVGKKTPKGSQRRTRKEA